MKNYMFYQALLKIFGVFLLVAFQFSAHAQVTVSLQYAEKNNLTAIPAGDLYTMQLNYSVSSTTGPATGVKAVINLPDEIIGIENLVGTVHAPVENFVFDNTIGAKKVTINFIDPLASGSTGVLEVGLRTTNGTVPNGTVLHSNAELTATGGYTSGVKNHSITITAAPYICTQKLFSSGGAIDNPTTYIIRVSGAGLSSGSVPLGYLNGTKITLTDNLPAGAQFVSAQLTNTFTGAVISTTITQNAGVITAVIPDLTASYAGFINSTTGWAANSYDLTVIVKYPSPTFSVGQTVNNTSSLVFTPLGGSPINVTHGSQVSPSACVNDLEEAITLAAPIVNATFAKTNVYGVGPNIYPGQRLSYCVQFANTGNVPLDNVEIIENIPANLRFAGKRFDYASYNIDHFEYQTNLNATWVTSPLNGTDPGPNPNNSAEYYTKLKIVLKTPFPANSTLQYNPGGNCPQFDFLAVSEVTVDTPVQNCIEWTSTTVGIPLNRTACENTMILKPRPTQAAISTGIDCMPGNNSLYNIGDTFTNILTIGTDVGKADLLNPVIMISPNQAGHFDYVPGSATFNPLASGMVATPTIEYIPNYAGSGRFLLRLTFPAGTVIPHGTTVKVSAQVKINNTTTNNDNLDYYVSGSNYVAPTTLFFNGFEIGAIDTYDFNDNGSTTDTLVHSDGCIVRIAVSASMESIKWVKGQLDTDYSRYPASGNTVRGGKADYKLVVTNTGNVPMKNINVVDILPFVGDHGVIDLSARNSEWRPNLAGPITAPAGVTVYYSTAQNPCRDEMKAASDPSPFPTGCTVANWTTLPPIDITTVQSLKFDFGSIVIQPGDSLLLTWPMRAPVDAPTNGEIAWNSFGFMATRTDNNAPLLAAEPIKVGIKLAAPAPAFYGDYVWYDTNHNGLQDTGEQGVDGVKVILFKDNGDNLANPATDTEIAFTVTGNGGKYLFPNLQAGNYYAVFFPPTSYSVSPPNQGADDAIDSDGTITTYQGSPAYITAITQLDANETDLTWDLGIYCGFTPTVASNSPVLVGGTLSLSASGGSSYSWTGPNNFVSTLPNPTIPSVTTANAGTYKVTVDNNGCYASLTVEVLVQNCVKPNAGTDVRICAPTTSATVVAAANGQTWSVQAGNPTSATITQAGQVTGMTAIGTYKFILSAGTGCTDTVQVVRGGLSLSITPGSCSTATNQYTLSGTVSLTNAIAGTLTITDGALSTTAAVTASTTAVSFSLTSQSSGSGSHTVTAALSSCGVSSMTYIAPASCTVAVALSATAGACNPATNQYTVSGTLSLTNAIAGTATITDGVSTTTVSVSAGATSVPYTLATLSSGTGSHTVTVSYVGKSTSTTYTAPASCTLGVALVITPGVCQSATNQYSVTGTLSLTNATVGTATFTDGATSTTVAVSAGQSTVSFSLTGLTSGSGLHTVVASFSGQTQSQTYTAPSSCTVGLGLSVTPGVCQSATNQYSISGTLSLTNAVAGMATITDGSSTTMVTVAAGATSVPYLLIGLNSDGALHTVTVSYAGKTASTTYTAPSSCTVAIAVSVTPGVCQSATNQYDLTGVLSLTNAVAGTATITDGTTSTTVAVSAGATSVPYSLTGLSSGTGSHTVTASYAGKSVSQTYTAPSSCTVAVALSVTPGNCTPATNQYSISGTISLTNAVAGTATITDGSSTTTIAISAGATSVAYTLSGLNSGTGSHTVTVSYLGKTAMAAYTAPASCTLGVGLIITPGLCQSATNQYAITGTLSLTNALAGTATFTDGPNSTTVAVAAGATSVGFSLTGLSSGTGSHTLTASFNGQTQSQTYTAPASCTVGLGLSVTPGVCQSATNQYSISGTISLTNAVVGTATISDGASTTTVSVAAGATSVAYSLTGLTSGTGSHTVTVSYAGKTASTTYTAPASCTVAPACGLALSLTPGLCLSATNTYVLSGTVSATNVPTSGTLTLSSAAFSTRTIALPTGNSSGTFSYSGLVSDGQPYTVTASYSNSACSPVSQTYTAPASCSLAPVCSISATATAGVCASATNTYSASVVVSLANAPAGTLTVALPGSSPISQTIAAGTPSFTAVFNGLLSDGATHTATISLPGCGTTTASFTAPASCSVAPVCSMSAVVSAGQCASATNTYSATAVVTVQNPVTGSLSVSLAGVTQTFATTANAQNTFTAVFNGLVSDGASHTVVASIPGCSTVSNTYTAPASCSVAPVCSLSAVTTAGACASATNTYSATTVVTLSHPTVGVLAVLNGGQSLTFTTSAVSSATYVAVFNGLTSDGASHTVVASLPGCSTVNSTYTAPASCSVAPTCGLLVTATGTNCNPATNLYVLAGRIILSNSPTSQTLTLTDGSYVRSLTAAAGTTTINFSYTTLQSDGAVHTVTVTSSGTACQAASTTYTAPASCTVAPVCSMSAVTTQSQCASATNTFSNTVTVSLSNPAAGVLTVSDGVSSLTFSVPATVGSVTTQAIFNGLISGSGSHTVVASLPGCSTVSTTYTAPASCSVAPVCSMSAVVSAGVCASATNTYSTTAVVTLNNPQVGVLTVSNGAQSLTFATTAVSSATYVAVFSGLTSDGASHTVVASLPGCGSTTTLYTAPASCTQAPQLTLDKRVDKSIAQVGDVLTYTLVLTNTGTVAASNVIVRDSSMTGLSYIANSATAPVGTTFTSGNPISNWIIPAIGAGQSLSLTFQARADSTGILYNTAIIPGDTAKVCTSVPVHMCVGDDYAFALTAPAGRSSYKWYRNGVEITGAISNVLSVTAAGTYSLVVDGSTGQCPDFSCCPFIIVEDTLPTFKANVVPVSCVGNTAQSNGQIVLSEFRAGLTYQYSLGANFNPAASLSGAAKAIPSNGVIVSNLANPVTAQAYTVRVYTASGCYRDVTVLLMPTVCGCPVEICVPYVIKQTKRPKRIGDPR